MVLQTFAERWLGEEMFRTDVGTSFVCTSQQTLLQGNPGSVGLVSVNFYDTQVEAFRVNATNTDFHAIGLCCMFPFALCSWVSAGASSIASAFCQHSTASYSMDKHRLWR